MEKLTINSLELAKMLSRTHGEVLKMIKGTSGKTGAIEVLKKQGIQNVKDYFIESRYRGDMDSRFVCYEVTEKGCEILADKVGHGRSSVRNPELTKESFLNSCANYFNELKQQDDMLSTPETNSLVNVFNNEEFGKIRTITINNEPWFVARDLSRALGYTSLEYMYVHIDNEDKKNIDPNASDFKGHVKTAEPHVLESNPNVRRMTIINESGLYSAIFGSKLPSAKKFKRWVTSEVLPSIRKNNAYNVSFSDKDILLKAVDIVDIKIKEKRDELNKLEQSRNIFNTLID